MNLLMSAMIWGSTLACLSIIILGFSLRTRGVIILFYFMVFRLPAGYSEHTREITPSS
jgi:hypothetical protein